jgi:hypothetical protein
VDDFDIDREAESFVGKDEMREERAAIQWESTAGRTAGENPRLVLSFQAFEVEKFDSIDSLWGDAFVVPGGGYLILGGDGGVGKTIFYANLALRMAAGEREFLGFKLPGRPVRVLFIEAEGSRARFRDWIVKIARNLGYEPRDLPIFFKTASAPIDLADNLRRMIEEAEAEFVVLDPIGAFFEGDENSAEEWRAGVTRSLKALSENLGVAFAFSDHYSKPNENRSGRNRVRGSAAKVQDCGTAMRLEIRKSGKSSRVLYIDRVRDGETPDPDWIALTVDLKKGTIDLDESTDLGNLAPTGEVRAAFLAEIIKARGEGAEVSTADLKEELKERYQVADTQSEGLITLAVEKGLIERASRGWYRLPGQVLS